MIKRRNFLVALLGAATATLVRKFTLRTHETQALPVKSGWGRLSKPQIAKLFQQANFDVANIEYCDFREDDIWHCDFRDGKVTQVNFLDVRNEEIKCL